LFCQYSLIKQWAKYLANNTLYPSSQLTTDIFESPIANLTNLAIKGVIGLGAMSKIASTVGQTSDATYYSVKIVMLLQINGILSLISTNL
jgi:hypothetical protein